MDAFDADFPIYAAVVGHPLAEKVAARGSGLGALLADGTAGRVNIGSTVLISELLAKPLREQRQGEVVHLTYVLSRLDLHPVDRAVAAPATVGARYRPRAADAIHLATAVRSGADRFNTNNRRDFDWAEVAEIDVTYPDLL